MKQAVGQKQLTHPAADNIHVWLTDPRYAQYAEQVAAHIASGQWKALDDAFWTIIPFGTGGRRGKMYPIGCNAINDRTIGESAQGLALYERARAIAREIGFDLPKQHRGGGSDGNFTAGMGVATLDGLGCVGAGAHAPYEHILWPSLAQRSRLILGLLETLH